MKHRLLVAALLALVCPSPATAQAVAQSDGVTGTALLRACELAMEEDPKDSRTADWQKRMQCTVLLRGIGDMTRLAPSLGVCIPDAADGYQAMRVVDAADGYQAMRVVVKFLTDHPERLHERDTWLVLGSFQKAWPCQ